MTVGRRASHNLGINITAQDQASGQIDAFEQRIRSMNNELERMSQNMQRASQATSQDLNAINNQTKQAAGATDDLNQSNREMADTADQAAEGHQKVTGGARESRQAQEAALESTDNWMSGYTRALDIAVRSVAIWGLATTAIYGTKRALEDAHQVIRDVNREMVAVRRVMDDLVTDFNAMTLEAAALGREFAESADVVVESMVGWARQGYEQEEVLQLTEAALLATNVAQMEAAESVDLLTAAILQFNMEAAEAIEVVDRINLVANEFAVTAQDLATSIRESGAAARSAGISMDELIGITTSLSATTAKSGSRIGRTLRTMFSRMMGDAQDAGAALGQVEIALNQVGIALRESETEYRDMMDVLTDLSLEWRNLDEVMRSNIARAMGGRRRYSDVIALMENWEMALDATETSLDSLNSAIEENQVYMESLDAQWQVARSTFEELSVMIGEMFGEDLSRTAAQTIQSMMGWLQDLAVGLNAIEESTGRVTQVISALGAYIASKLIVAITNAVNKMILMNSINMQLASSTALVNSKLVMLKATLAAIKFPLFLVAAGAVASYAASVGEAEAELQELEAMQEDVNTILEEGAALSLQQSQRLQGTIEEMRELADVGREAVGIFVEGVDDDTLMTRIREEALATRTVMDDIKTVIYAALTPGEDAISFAEEPMALDYAFANIQDTVTALDTAIDDIDWTDFFEIEIDWIQDAEQLQSVLEAMGKDVDEDFIPAVEDFLRASEETFGMLERQIRNSVGWIDRYVTEQAELTEQRIRETRVLQDQVNTMFDLIGGLENLDQARENLSVKEFEELYRILSSLEENFLEVAAAGRDFNEIFEIMYGETGLLAQQLEKYGEEGYKVEQMQDQLRASIESLSDAHDELVQRQADMSSELMEATDLLELVSDGAVDVGEVLEATGDRFEYLDVEDIIEGQLSLADAVEILRHRFTETGDVLERLEGTKRELGQRIVALDQAYDDFDNDLYISQMVEAIDILEEFGEEVDELAVKLEDFEDRLQVEETALDWLKDLTDDLDLDEDFQFFTDLDHAEERFDIIEDATDDLIDGWTELERLKIEPFTAETAAEVEEAIKDLTELDEIDMDIDEIIRVWEEDSEEDFIEVIEELQDDYETYLRDMIKELEEQHFVVDFEELMEVDIDSLQDKTDEELEEYVERAKRIEEYFKGVDFPPINLGELYDFRPPISAEQKERISKDILLDLTDALADAVDEDIDIEFDVDATTTERLDYIQKVLGGLRHSVRDVQEEKLSFDIETAELEDLETFLSDLEDRYDSIEEVQEDFEEAADSDILSEYGEQVLSLAEYLGLTESNLKELLETVREEITLREMSANIRGYELELMGEYERQLFEVTQDLQQLSQWEEEVSDEDLLERIEKVREQFESQREGLEMLMELDLDKFEDVFDINIGDLGLGEIIDMMEDLPARFEDGQNRLEEIGMTAEELEELTGISFDEDELERILNELDNRLANIAQDWANNFSAGIQQGIEVIREMDDPTLFDGIAQVFGRGLSQVLADDDTFATTMQFLDEQFEDGADRWSALIEEPVIEGLRAGLGAMIDPQASFGSGFMSAVGTGIGSIFGSPQVGAAIGSALGDLGDALFGGIEGREEMELGKEINESIEEAKEGLAEFSYEYDALMVEFEDTASAWRSFWGGEDWEVENLEEAQEDLEYMEETLQRMEGVFGQIGQDLQSAMAEATNYSDFRTIFEESIGQALFDAIIDQLVAAQLMEDEIKELVGMVTTAVEADRLDDDTFAQELEEGIASLVDGGEEIFAVLEEAGIRTQLLGEEIEMTMRDVADSITEGFTRGMQTATSYSDFRDRFDDTLGSALRDSLVEHWIEGMLIEEQISDIFEEYEDVFADGFENIDEDVLSNLIEDLSEVADGAEEGFEWLQKLDEEIDIDLFDQVQPAMRIVEDLVRELDRGLKTALDYDEFKEDFDESVGQALRDSLVEHFIEGMAIEDELEDIFDEYEGIFQDGADINEEMLAEFVEELERIPEIAEEGFEWLKSIDEEIDIDLFPDPADLRAEQIADDLMSGFVSAISGADYYSEFRREFDESIGQAIHDAVIQRMIETKLIEEQIAEIAEIAARSLEEEGEITKDVQEEIARRTDEVIKDGKAIWNALQDLDLGLDEWDDEIPDEGAENYAQALEESEESVDRSIDKMKEAEKYQAEIMPEEDAKIVDDAIKAIEKVEDIEFDIPIEELKELREIEIPMPIEQLDVIEDRLIGAGRSAARAFIDTIRDLQVQPDTFEAASPAGAQMTNQFVVKSEVFIGDEASAKAAARKLAPYIEANLKRKGTI